MAKPSIAAAARTGLDGGRVDDTVRAYREQFQSEDPTERKASYAKLVNQYYDLVTDFYEYGWGQSFHFGARRRGEGFEESLRRHEFYLASRAGFGDGDRVLDVGCGVGGPMRNIAHFSGARVVGINNNAYQIERGQAHNRKAGLEGQCEFAKGDFMQMPFEAASFDAAYAIEATCHAPDRLGVYSEVYRVLKPGGCFVGYEWIVTDPYDAGNAEHRRLIRDIEEGDALPELQPRGVVDDALRGAGFELLESRDLGHECDPETPWYLPLTGKERTLKSLPRTRWGRFLVHRAVRVMERLKIAPKGSAEVSTVLNIAADALVTAGELGIFTPMYFFLGRKPE